jgi:hypothetical protein
VKGPFSSPNSLTRHDELDQAVCPEAFSFLYRPVRISPKRSDPRGLAVLGVLFIGLCEPGQPAPYDTLPFVALDFIALARAIGGFLVHRNRAPERARDNLHAGTLSKQVR